MKTPDIVKYEIPFNGSSDIIDIYAKYHKNITCVYGKANDKYPEGRNTRNAKKISLDDIEIVAREINNYGIPFNYILNGNNHSNKEYDKQYRNDFVAFVKKIKSKGCSIVTLSNLFLIELIRNEIPDIDVNVSILLEVDNLTRVKHLEKLGVKSIVLSKTLLKNINGLQNIAKHKPKNIDLVLLANDPCLHHCAYTQYHNQSLSYFTAEGGDFVNYCRLHCTNDFASDVRKIISASFIRPEDIGFYEELGFSHFKLTERKQTTPWIAKATKAYMERSYEGNLSDILSPWSSYSQPYTFPDKIENLQTNTDLANSRSNLRFTPEIKNRELDGYLDYWKKVKVNGCANEDCDSCNYCLKVAKKACEIDEKWLQLIKDNTAVATKFAVNVNAESE